MNTEGGAAFIESSSSWSRTSLLGALNFSPSEVRTRSWSMSDPDVLHLKSLSVFSSSVCVVSRSWSCRVRLSPLPPSAPLNTPPTPTRTTPAYTAATASTHSTWRVRGHLHWRDRSTHLHTCDRFAFYRLVDFRTIWIDSLNIALADIQKRFKWIHCLVIVWNTRIRQLIRKIFIWWTRNETEVSCCVQDAGGDQREDQSVVDIGSSNTNASEDRRQPGRGQDTHSHSVISTVVLGSV